MCARVRHYAKTAPRSVQSGVSEPTDVSDLSGVSDAAAGRLACPEGLKEVQRRVAMALFYAVVGIYAGFGAWTWWQLLHALLH